MDFDALKSRTFSLAELIESHAALHLDLADDLRGLDPEIFFSPQGEFWSPAQHVDHLIRSVRPMARALRMPYFLLNLLFARDRPKRSLQTIVDSYLGKLADGAGAGGPYLPEDADKRTVEPARQEALLDKWLKTGRALGSSLSRWKEGGLDRYRLPHPLLGMLTIREMLGWSLYHGHHHRSRIQERM